MDHHQLLKYFKEGMLYLDGSLYTFIISFGFFGN